MVWVAATTIRASMLGIGTDDLDKPLRWDEYLLGVIALLIPVAYVDAFFVPSWTPRMALLLVVLPLGTLHLLRQARTKDTAARSAICFLLACTSATIISGAPLWNVRGGFARESSLVFVGGFFALWALTRTVSVSGREFIVRASIAGLALSGLVGVAQLVAQPTDGFLQMIGNRPSGLSVNPVYFGALMAGAGAIAARAWTRDRVGPAVGAVAVGSFAGLVNLSGSRGAALAFVLAIVFVAATATERVQGAKAAVAAILGVALTSVSSPLSSGRDTLDRTTESDVAARGLDGRSQIWRYGIEAFIERPLRGHGFGQFRAATQRHFEPDFVRRFLTDSRTDAWPDAHNVVIQYAVVGGVIGVTALVVFVLVAVKTARGATAIAAAVIGFTWLLQPATLATLPIAALWLGAAMPFARPGGDPVGSDAEPAGDPSRAPMLLVAMGILVAVSLVGLDNRLDQALNSGDVQKFSTWARLAPDDPVIAATTAGLHTKAGPRTAGVAWSKKVVELEPHDAVGITDLSRRLLEIGRTSEAVEVIERALEVDPYNSFALETALVVGDVAGLPELESSARAGLCELARPGCNADDEAGR